MEDTHYLWFEKKSHLTLSVLLAQEAEFVHNS